MKTNGIDIVSAMQDKALFARWFKNLETWRAWIVFLKSLFALPMTETEAEIFTRHTGREVPPTQPATEGWLLCGRRSGKSFIAALIAVFLACFRDYSPYLAPGERAVVMVLASDRRQARVIFRYIRAFLEIPLLSGLVQRETNEEIDLSNRVSLEVHTSSFRAVRGYSIAACLADEICFWENDGANPDHEILAALKPAMATIPGSLLLALSSPYSRRGEAWETFKRCFGQDGPVLVWQAPTEAMNPTVPAKVIADAYERDAAAADAEWGGNFRRDIEALFTQEAVEACVPSGVRERPPVAGVSYVAFVDPSGGSADSFTLGIAHEENGRAVLDCIRERRPPFSPDSVVKEYADLLRSYGLHRVIGDRYGGEWPREKFLEHGIHYEPASKSKSELYLETLPLVNGQRCELLDNDRLVGQLLSLERRTSRGGRDSVDAPPRQHEDLANAACGVLVEVAAGAGCGIDVEGIQIVTAEERRATLDDHFADLDREYAPWDRPPWPEGYEPFQ